ncbi:DNA internalization competence protein, ComEC/Rec2 family protein [Cyanobium sp. PCC 7001]|nr:DNA internalization competence protein, ComEC/Rec2 family protein [Cyanobium sp. PCC 7001]
MWGALVLLVLLRAVGLVALPSPPAAGDPVWGLAPAGGGSGEVVLLRGRLLSDAQPAGGGQCRALLQLPVGRTELRLPACEPLQDGWRLAVQGRLRQPQPAPHPLLAGPAERLRRVGAATQLQVEQLTVLSRPPTPVADLRRALAQRLVEAAGPERGGVLAALVLGSARVPLPDTVRQAFRAAGLSHALAASGFHLSVVLTLSKADVKDARSARQLLPRGLGLCPRLNRRADQRRLHRQPGGSADFGRHPTRKGGGRGRLRLQGPPDKAPPALRPCPSW